ncbi:MAG: ADP-ribosylation factor-directed GTPase activating protein isoform b [Pirellulaceae bacterium]
MSESYVALSPDANVASPKIDAIPIAERVKQTLKKNQSQRGLSTRLHGAWQVLHGVLAYGKDFSVETNDGSQKAVKYLLDGGSLDGFTPRAGDKIGTPPRTGVKVELQPASKIGQGHRDQWLAVLIQSGLAEDDTLTTPDGTFTVRDWINQTQYDVPLNLETEFSWTLIGLTALDPTTTTWAALDGETYSTELLLQSEVHEYRTDAQSGACGGTHRLIGIAMALNKRRSEKAPITGVWADAQQVIDSAIATAKQNQNSDGSYSTSYFHRPGWTRDLGESLGTTGHVLEFLAIAAPDDVLQEPWVERTARRLCDILDRCDGIDLECGVLYHALHGLAEYKTRISK